MQETVARLEQRNSELEERFAELTQTLLQNQAREAEQSDQLESEYSMQHVFQLETYVISFPEEKNSS